VDAKGVSKGFVLVQYTDPSSAAEAFHNLDGEPFQGRLLHILPAAAKRENKLDEFAIAKLPLKKQKQIKKKSEASSTTFNWNSLYMNQDAVNSAIADRLGVSKSELLDPTSADSGVKQAIAETSVIRETKEYFAKHGVDLNAFKKRERGDTAILVKNFPYGMSLEELRKMFEEFGQVLRVLMPPIGTIAIIEFAQPSEARAAFGRLAYRRMKDSVLFLEKAPKDVFTGVSSNATIVPSDRQDLPTDQKLSAFDLLEAEGASHTVDTSTLFVRNLNFTTTRDVLTETFKPLDGFMSARVNTKMDPKKPGQALSMGFGFLEFRSKAQAQAALKAMDGYVLEGHKLVIKASHKGLDAAEERRKEDRAKKVAGKRTKIIIKNLPFEATKKDVRTLFGSYGQLRSVRVPKKFDHSARGFAFADFITAREAENALEALKDTHLLGRRLVLEFAAGDALDAEEEIEKMQKKIGSQVNMVALQKLTGQGRKKFNIEGDNADED
jgi:multiple RNA-binding domain-containing protein 1